MTADLTRADLDLALQSLRFTRQAFEAYRYPDYPSFEFRDQRIADVDLVASKLRAIRRGVSA